MRHRILPIILAAVTLSCQNGIQPQQDFEKYFLGLDSPSRQTPFVIGYPDSGSVFYVGDTLTVAYKRIPEAVCFGIELSSDGGQTYGNIVHTIEGNDSFPIMGFSTENVRLFRQGDIYIVKWKIRSKLPNGLGYFFRWESSSDSVSTVGENVLISMSEVLDCCCTMGYGKSNVFHIRDK